MKCLYMEVYGIFLTYKKQQEAFDMALHQRDELRPDRLHSEIYSHCYNLALTM